MGWTLYRKQVRRVRVEGVRSLALVGKLCLKFGCEQILSAKQFQAGKSKYVAVENSLHT